MDRKEIEKATALFQEKFGMPFPRSKYPVIEVYKEKRMYLYAASKEAAQAFKICQNIIRWLMLFYLWPLILGLIVFIRKIVKSHDWSSPLIQGVVIFCIIWICLFFILWYKAAKADKKQKGKVIWLNY